MNKAQIAVGAMFPIIVAAATCVCLAGGPARDGTNLHTQLEDAPAPTMAPNQPQQPESERAERDNPHASATPSGSTSGTAKPSTKQPTVTPDASNTPKPNHNAIQPSEASQNASKPTSGDPGTSPPADSAQTAAHSPVTGAANRSATSPGSGAGSHGSVGPSNTTSPKSGKPGPETGARSRPADGKMVAFDPNSWLYQSVRAAPVDPKSAAYVKRLHRTISSRYLGIAAVNSHQYNSSFYIAEPGTPKVNMMFNDCQNKGWLDEQFKKALRDVPIPAGAKPAVGEDKHLTIYDPAQDVMWEFWVAQKQGNTWSACWGGRLDDVSTSQGYFTGVYGATATGISQAATAISIDQAQAGKITHAMCLVVVDAKKWTEYSWPAQRSDGHVDAPDAMPEGRRLRLDPNVNVDALDLTPFAKTVAKAAQEYGFVVCDKGGAVAVVTESGEQAKVRTGVNPWDEMFGQTPAHEQLRNFPWNRLQVMPANYGKPQ